VKAIHRVGNACFFKLSSNAQRGLTLAMLLVSVTVSSPVRAQSYCEFGDYNIVYKTVYERQPVTRYKLVVETVYEEREVTVRRPEWTVETQTRKVFTRKPVTEQSTRIRKRTVMKPVWETRYRTQERQEIHYDTEESERIEYRTILRPVIERHDVERHYTVQKPVTETVTKYERVLTYRPHVDYRTEIVDRGEHVYDLVRQPGKVSHRLKWLPSGYYCDPATKQQVWRRAGLHWVPQQAADQVKVQRRYVPNLIEKQVPVHSWRPEVVTLETPVATTRYVDEQIVERVPVTVQRMVRVEQMRRVPVTVRKPVVETIVEKIPYRVLRWEPQEIVDEIPITTRRYVLEEYEEQVSVRVCRMVTETKKIQVPHTVRRWVKYESTRLVPRRVMQRVYPGGRVGGTAGSETAKKEPTPADRKDDGSEEDGDQSAKETENGGDPDLNAPVRPDA
jgi:hypothetical protein